AQRRHARVEQLDRRGTLEDERGGEKEIDVEVGRVVRDADLAERLLETAMPGSRHRVGAPTLVVLVGNELDVAAIGEPLERGGDMTVLALRPPLDMLVAELELELVAVHRPASERRKDQNLDSRRRVAASGHRGGSLAGASREGLIVIFRLVYD